MTADARRRAEEALATMNGVLLAWGPQPPMSKSAALCHAISVGTVALEALLAAEKAREEAEERLTLKRREYDIEVEVHAATKRERDSYIKGYEAAESRAARLLTAMREIAWHELPVGTAMDAIFQDIARRAIAAEREERGKEKGNG